MDIIQIMEVKGPQSGTIQINACEGASYSSD